MEHEKDSASSSRRPSLFRDLLGSLVVFCVFVASFWSKFKTPVEQSAESRHPQNNTNQGCDRTKPPSPLAVTIESYPPPPITQKDEAEKKEERFLKRGNFVATALTAAFAFGLLCVTYKYAKYTYNMWIEMQGQTCIQRDASMNAERAWVGLDAPPSVNIGLLEHGRTGATIDFTVKDYGKGPAFSVMASAQVVPSNTDNRHAVEDALESTCNLISVFVGLKPTRPVYSDEDMAKHQWGHVVFPNQPFRTGTVTTIDMPKMIGKEVYVTGCIVYRDQFSEPHWTKFCYNTGDFARDVVKDASSFKHLYLCNANNYTDDIEKKPSCPVTQP